MLSNPLLSVFPLSPLLCSFSFALSKPLLSLSLLSLCFTTAAASGKLETESTAAWDCCREEEKDGRGGWCVCVVQEGKDETKAAVEES